LQAVIHIGMKKTSESVVAGVLTASDAASVLGVTRRWFYALVKEGKAPKAVARIGNMWLWDRNAIEAMGEARS
jgi:predicted DNA-binding transcriptional regulator AlpA